MTETLVLLIGAVLLTLPSLISHKKETGREALRTVVFFQGGLGFVLSVAAAVVLVASASSSGETIKAWGALVWGSRLTAFVTALCVGAVVFLNLVIRLSCLKASPETRERSERIFFSLFEFQTAAGFFCLVLVAWTLLVELVITPLLPA